MMEVFVIILLGISAAGAAQKDYDGYKVFEIKPKNIGQLNALQAVAKTMNLDVWKKRGVGSSTHIMVEPGMINQFLGILQANDMTEEIKIPNVGDLVKAEKEAMKAAKHPKRKRQTGFNYTMYHPLDEIEIWMTSMVANAPSDINVTKIQIGYTYENRPIHLLKIDRDPAVSKPDIVMIHGVHAREWIAPATAMFFVDNLVNIASDSVWSSFNWHILPVSNPDGYVYSWNQDRLWRKTTSTYDDIPARKGKKTYTCSDGVDFNRNFDYAWQASVFPNGRPECESQTFSGPAAWSETEVRAVRDYILNLYGTVEAFFDIHSYGQMVLFPYGSTLTPVPDYDDLLDIGILGATAINDIDGQNYTVGQISQILYTVNGGSLDWTYANQTIKNSFAFELRDKGTYGFLLPAAQIVPTGNEFIAGIKAMVGAIANML